MIGSTETVTVRTRVQGADDPYGQPTWTWTETAVAGCLYAPATGNEANVPTRQDVTIEGTVYMPSSTVVSSRSQLIIRGDTYAVQGEPGVWLAPFSPWSIVVNVTRAEG